MDGVNAKIKSDQIPDNLAAPVILKLYFKIKIIANQQTPIDFSIFV
jgi:hypothetical protein